MLPVNARAAVNQVGILLVPSSGIKGSGGG